LLFDVSGSVEVIGSIPLGSTNYLL